MSTDAQIAKENAEWQATSDANTLAEADVILNNGKRLKAAKKAAKDLAEDAKARFDGMMKVAGKSDIVEGMKVINRTDH